MTWDNQHYFRNAIFDFAPPPRVGAQTYYLVRSQLESEVLHNTFLLGGLFGFNPTWNPLEGS